MTRAETARIAAADLGVNLVREILDLEAAARRLLVRASETLRSGRGGWEPWFEAGMELRESAERLRSLVEAVDPTLADLLQREQKRRR